MAFCQNREGVGFRFWKLVCRVLGTLALALSLLGTATAFEGEVASAPKLLVRFKDDSRFPPSTVSIERLATQEWGAKLAIPPVRERWLPFTRTQVLEFENQTDAEISAQELRQDPTVAEVEIDQVVQTHAVPNDTYFSNQWVLNNEGDPIHAIQAWDQVNSAENILIAVVDSGCEIEHPDLTGNLWKNSGEIPENGIDDDKNGYVDDFNGYDFLEKDGTVNDDNGHGTMVAGVIGAMGNNGQGVTGIAWDAQIMCLKCINEKGQGNISNTIEAIEFAIANGVKIINASWGATGVSSSSFLERAIAKADEAGILFVTSAGNDGLDTDIEGNFTFPSGFPENNLISVAASDFNDNLASFSNYGKQSVDLAAPGVEVFTTITHSDYAYFTGTSAGVPFVTGSAALLWALNPHLDHLAVKKLLLENTDVIPALEGKISTGGRLNLGKAIAASPNGKDLSEPTTPPADSPSEENKNFSSASGGCHVQPGDFPNSALATGWFGITLLLLGWQHRGLISRRGP